ncbi:hypothetical protein SAMN02745857_00866 [Andreprevotia lacus DSM 23236]|jgi:hypothetical protein|uniref:Uncharacterized protein n=1 Tax=Andreprevotia lacus DSM 23236 TaxID=1121001 RepID=A0A1W1X8A5_9NEIS|nr:hypothetical protein [Andreprevotia lacus]SMC20215.1 hypothetical protein SAMN02745857_00866 [Andreprevotia lacus DSM 23236]
MALRYPHLIALFCSVLLLVCGMTSAAATQQCGPATIVLIGKTLQDPDFDGPDAPDKAAPAGIVATACRAAPQRGLTLAAVAYQSSAGYEKKLVIALLDPARQQVVASYRGKIDEDGATRVRDDSLHFDARAYALAPGVSAFGLEIDADADACMLEGGLGPFKILYIRDGQQIRPVTPSIHTGGWHLLRGQRCTDGGEILIQQMRTTISTKPGKARGWHDLQLDTRTAFIRLREREHDQRMRILRSTPGHRKTTQRLHYDGTQYPLAGWEKARDALWRPR